MGNESKKKHILEKFFNFSKAFILHAKIPHSTHTLAPRKISFSSFPYIPYSPRHWYLFSLCSWKRSFACRNAVGHEMENEGQHKLKITEKPRIRIREIESKERKSRRRSVLWSCSFIYERLRWLSAVFPPNCPYDRVFHTPTL